jgi:chromate transporter
MDAAQPAGTATAPEVFLAFLRQGLTAFGGPTAHLGYFRREFVERRRWLSDAAFADLVALCHFLPGPASSQIGMAIGMRQAGLAGALAAFAGFTLPAAVVMIAFAAFAPELTAQFGRGWLHGLQLAAAAVVAQAVLKMARTLAAGPVRGGMAVGAAICLVLYQQVVAKLDVLVAGRLLSVDVRRGQPG